MMGPDTIALVRGVAGILSAFTDAVQAVLHKQQMVVSQQRIVGCDLLYYASTPEHFVSYVSKYLRDEPVMLSYASSSYYTYEQGKVVLRNAGIDVAARERADKKHPDVSLYYEDLSVVFAYLYMHVFPTPIEQRAFAEELRKALGVVVPHIRL